MRRQADDGILLSQEAMRMTDEKGVQSIERALDIIESVAEEQKRTDTEIIGYGGLIWIFWQ